jgi:hypothetical protein
VNILFFQLAPRLGKLVVNARGISIGLDVQWDTKSVFFFNSKGNSEALLPEAGDSLKVK